MGRQLLLELLGRRPGHRDGYQPRDARHVRSISTKASFSVTVSSLEALKRVLPLLCCTALLTLAGCSGSDQKTGSEGSNSSGSSAQSAAVDWAQLPLTGRLYRTPPAQLRKWARADQARTQDKLVACMAAQGFDGYSSTEMDAAAYVIGYSRRALNEEQARTRGLRILELDSFQAETPPIQFGDSRGGPIPYSPELEDALQVCRDDSLETTRAILGDLVASYKSDVEEPAGISEARVRWATCIRDSGFDASNVEGLAQSVQEAAPVPQPGPNLESEIAASTEYVRQHEIDAALAQVECDRQEFADAIPEWATAEKAWVDDHASQLNQLGDLQQLEVVVMVENDS